MSQYLKTTKMEQKFMSKRDLWQEYVNLKAGNFDAWFKLLSHEEKLEFMKLQEEARKGDANKKLLKG
jgi:hypothetical protein